MMATKGYSQCVGCGELYRDEELESDICEGCAEEYEDNEDLEGISFDNERLI